MLIAERRQIFDIVPLCIHRQTYRQTDLHFDIVPLCMSRHHRNACTCIKCIGQITCSFFETTVAVNGQLLLLLLHSGGHVSCRRCGNNDFFCCSLAPRRSTPRPHIASPAPAAALLPIPSALGDQKQLCSTDSDG